MDHTGKQIMASSQDGALPLKRVRRVTGKKARWFTGEGRITNNQ